LKTKASKKFIASASIALGLIIPQVAPTITYADVMEEDIVNLRIVETTDIHSNIMNYDYYKGSSTNAYGLSKAATLINELRSEVDNSLLFDNGDLIQGSPLGDYVYNNDLMKGDYVHPVYKAMNLLGYDAATVGNHEFNYGLEFLETALNGAEFPYVNANVYDTEGNNYFTPFEILEREVIDQDGETHKIKVGVTGFVPQGIMSWDAKHLDGKLVVEDIVKSAEKVVPKMKEAGADVVVVLSHSGIAEYDQDNKMKEYYDGMENASYYLSQVEGIDAILTGHQHQSFPNAEKPSFPDGNGIDNTNGTINGIPTIMPGSWGNNIGTIDLTIEKVDGEWDVTAGTAALSPITAGETTVEANEDVVKAVQTEHEATIKYMDSPVGELKGDLNTYFGLVQDNAAMEILNRAQAWYVENALKGSEYEGLPILSAAAPFKAGRGGVEDFTDVKSGTLVLKNIADLYLYDNNVVNAVKVNGTSLKEWLEWSAGQFNTIDPNSTEEQMLINGDFPTYNFDVIDGVTYEVDVTSKPKYDKGQNLINADANRIKNLKYNGKPVTSEMEFIVATNDYRAAGSKLMNPGGVNTVYKAPDSNRVAMMNYVMEHKTIDAAVNNNWSFTPVDANITFLSNPRAAELAKKTEHITYTGKTDEKGFGIFTIDLSKSGSVTKGFSDVPTSHWAYGFINDLKEQGIVKGVSETKFNPEGTLTRGHFIAMVVRSLGITSNTANPFTDVPEYLIDDVAAAFEAGITDGVSATKFNPNAPITREQMAAMLVRAYEVKTGKDFEPTTTSKYSDAKSISSYAKEYVDASYELEFMIGYDGKFSPKNNATRAEAAKVVSLLNNK
jgi:2',3'-cyclic-nucleotide 2'-phosphodiesterase / 3'-nucleotidase